MIGSILTKIGNGVLYGIGISLVLGTTYYFLTMYITEHAMQEYKFERGDIEIIEHRKIERDGGVTILGSVKNLTESKKRSFTVTVDLYKNEQFTKQCTEYISGAVEPDEIRNFEVNCRGCKENLIDYDTYKIYLTGF